MKETFTTYMINQQFREAAELLHKETLNIEAPSNAKLTINVDWEKVVGDLAAQLQKFYAAINNDVPSFDTMLEIVFSAEPAERQHLRNDEVLLSKLRVKHQVIINEMQVAQIDKFYDGTLMVLKGTLQGAIDAAGLI